MDSNSIHPVFERLLATDPRACLQWLNDMAPPAPVKLQVRYFIRAGILCRDIAAIEQGSLLLQQQLQQQPQALSPRFSLANSQYLLAELYLEHFQPRSSRAALSSARQHYRQLMQHPHAKPVDRAYAATRLGQLLAAAQRWLEAYDCYRQALADDPKNNIARDAAQQLLGYIEAWFLGDGDTLQAERLWLRDGPREPQPRLPLSIEGESYRDFVCRLRLMLTPELIQPLVDLAQIDHLAQAALPPCDAEILQRYHQLQAQYCELRQHWFGLLSQPLPYHCGHHQLCDHCCVLLDHLAALALRWLALPNPPLRRFCSAWFRADCNNATLLAPVAGAIRAGNQGLQALTELARDPIMSLPLDPPDQGQREALAHLQRCRAALLYFINMLAQPGNQPWSNCHAPLYHVPPHPELHERYPLRYYS